MDNVIKRKFEHAVTESVWRPSGEVEFAYLYELLQGAGISLVLLDSSKDEPEGNPSRLGLSPDAHWPWVNE